MKIAIIGGSLLGDIASFKKHTEEQVKTPFGQPSDPFSTGMIGEHEVIYLNRHGHGHYMAPHQINYRANLFALKMLEVTHVLSVTAVGGITENMPPMQWVVPDQIIDYTYGRMQTYNDGNDHEVKHIDFTCPFTESLRQQLINAVDSVTDMEDIKLQCASQATYGATQGPRLETMAEIKRLEKDGCDIVGMTAMPEAALARELEIDYATLSLVVNWAAGKGSNQKAADPETGDLQPAIAISLNEIKQRISDGNTIVEKIINQAVSFIDEPSPTRAS